ncbi:MAG: flagellin lysine-N-methylase, partial [Oscillospiraceae bacterium]|nr:flagellin lysine-N-methylase [Oscillospiraceae bacterium]
RCLAGHCPDSCCQEWDVDVDDDSAARYQALPGPLGDRLREKLKNDGDGWYLKITDRRCPMWRADGLCQIQHELGEEALCQVCHQFPRLRHDYGDFLELGLELSCPEAARLILTQPWDTVTTEIPGGEDPDYDKDLMAILLESREEALQILHDQPLPHALPLLLLYAYRVQDRIDGGEKIPFDPESELSFARKHAQPSPTDALRQLYLSLELLTDRWRDLLSSPDAPAPWQEHHRAFLRYGISRYWLQAVSDWDLVCRVKLLLSAVILLRHLPGDPIHNAQLWSKEIETSAENVDALLDAAYTHPALTDTRLLGMLIE